MNEQREEQIKFIACDLDGTLLDPQGNLPKGIFDAIAELYERGILFCPASGRQLTALESMFAPVADKILFLAENGAIVAKDGNILRLDSLRQEDILHALEVVSTLPRAHALLCTPDCAYYQSEEQPFLSYVEASYISNAKGNLAALAKRDKVCKIAVYDELGPENNGMKVLPRALPHLRIIQSGGNWLDISEKRTDKGSAVRFIRKKFGFPKSACAAFGDHMNDYEMLLECGHPYVTANAYPPLKEKIGKSVPSNAEQGVLQALHCILEGKLP